MGRKLQIMWTMIKWCLCLQWKHNVKPNTVWSLSLSTTMQLCGSACCGVYWWVWLVVHHQWFVACLSWDEPHLSLFPWLWHPHISLFPNHHKPTHHKCPYLVPELHLEAVMTGDFQTQSHLWWLMKRVFNSLMSWCIPSFHFTVNVDSFELWTIRHDV